MSSPLPIQEPRFAEELSPVASRFAQTLRTYAQKHNLHLATAPQEPAVATVPQPPAVETATQHRVTASVPPQYVPVSVPQQLAKQEIARKKAPLLAGSPLTTGTLTAKELATQKPEPEPELIAEPHLEPMDEPTVELKSEKKTPPQPLLLRAWKWLQKNQKFAAAKQLRVAETVSLGDKRFVSLIQVDGQKFLIGGGTSGVSLLTSLGSQASAEALQAIAGAAEQSK